MFRKILIYCSGALMFALTFTSLTGETNLKQEYDTSSSFKNVGVVALQGISAELLTLGWTTPFAFSIVGAVISEEYENAITILLGNTLLPWEAEFDYTAIALAQILPTVGALSGYHLNSAGLHFFTYLTNFMSMMPFIYYDKIKYYPVFTVALPLISATTCQICGNLYLKKKGSYKNALIGAYIGSGLAFLSSFIDRSSIWDDITAFYLLPPIGAIIGYCWK